MAWETAKTWYPYTTDGEPVTSRDFNREIRDHFNDLRKPDGLAVGLSSSVQQTISDGSRQAVNWTADEWQVGDVSWSDGADITIARSGRWSFDGSIRWNVDANDRRSVYLSINGDTKLVARSAAVTSATTPTIMPWSYEADIELTDDQPIAVQVLVEQNSNDDLAISGTNNGTRLVVTYLGPVTVP